MTTNYDKAINRIKEENGGVLPSGLYLQTNEQLSKLIYDLSGKVAPPRTSKKVLVARIEKLTLASQASSATTLKRKADEITPGLAPAPAPPKKVPRGCLPQLTAVQIYLFLRQIMSSFASSCPCCPATEPPRDCAEEFVPGFAEEDLIWRDEKHL
eukprot:gene18658-21231_t